MNSAISWPQSVPPPRQGIPRAPDLPKRRERGVLREPGHLDVRNGVFPSSHIMHKNRRVTFPLGNASRPVGNGPFPVLPVIHNCGNASFTLGKIFRAALQAAQPGSGVPLFPEIDSRRSPKTYYLNIEDLTRLSGKTGRPVQERRGVREIPPAPGWKPAGGFAGPGAGSLKIDGPIRGDGGRGPSSRSFL